LLYRQRPVTVEAMQIPLEWNGSAYELRFKDWLFSTNWWPAIPIKNSQRSNGLYIETPEGVLYASGGDWIVKAERGEFLPVKQNVFEATYELLTLASAAEMEYI
jgi:hypothetical protein